jgi:hypothetical protein
LDTARLFAQASRFTICPFRPTTIGQPFVLRLQPDTLSGADLYAEIVTNVQRFIRTPLPASASIAASRSTLSSASMGAIDTAMDSDDSDAPRSTVSAGLCCYVPLKVDVCASSALNLESCVTRPRIVETQEALPRGTHAKGGVVLDRFHLDVGFKWIPWVPRISFF